MKKLQGLREKDPEWIKEIAEGLLDVNINNLSNDQKKMLSDNYIENLHEGLKPRDAMQKALQVVLCFNL